MKSKILHLGYRSFLGFNFEDGSDKETLDWLELINKCDKTVFWRDLHNFLNSKYMCDCFLQVGIPHYCKIFSPAPVGKIKLT